MNWYEEKLEAKRLRLEQAAERKAREGRAKYDSGWRDLKAIPFGQPILVGHHSEKRDRNYRRKACNRIDKGHEMMAEAQALEARAEGLGTHGISSDDPDAPGKLAERIAELEAKQARMTAGNKVVRAFWKAGHRATQSDEELARYFAKMAEAGWPVKALARSLLAGDYCGRIGFPGYELTNNSANIRRLKDRLKMVTRKAAEREAEPVREEQIGDVRLVENREINRLQIFFPGKPSPEVRQGLKQGGFRWSPSEGAWQRQLSNSAVYAAKRIIETGKPW